VTQLRSRRQKSRSEDNEDEEGDDDDEDLAIVGNDEDTLFTADDIVRRSDGRFTTNLFPLLPAGVPVCGYVRIVAPPRRVIPHNGVTATLESMLIGADDVNNKELFGEQVTLCGPGDFSGVADLPFAFLEAANHVISESFEGSLFSIRNRVFVEILRPWYTFSVKNESPFCVHAVTDAPSGVARASVVQNSSTDGKERNAKSGSGKGDGSESVEAPMAPTLPLHPALLGDGSSIGPQKVALDDMEEGATVALEINNGIYELSSKIRGRIVCSGVKTPLLLVKLAIVRVEYYSGKVANTVVFDDTVMDARKWKVNRDRRRVRAGLSIRSKKSKETEAALSSSSMSSSSSALSSSAAAAVASSASGGETSSTSQPSISVTTSGDSSSAPTAATVLNNILTEKPKEDDFDEAGYAEYLAKVKRGEIVSNSADDGDNAEEEFDPEDWVASPEEYAAEDPDPDLPLLGNVQLGIDLDLNLLSLSPTHLIPRRDVTPTEEETQEALNAGVPVSDAGRASVRYFLRLTVYTKLQVKARRSKAIETIFFRQRLAGDIVPEFRLPSKYPDIEVSEVFKQSAEIAAEVAEAQRLAALAVPSITLPSSPTSSGLQSPQSPLTGVTVESFAPRISTQQPQPSATSISTTSTLQTVSPSAKPSISVPSASPEKKSLPSAGSPRTSSSHV